MDWLRSEDLKEEKNVTAPVAIIAVCRAFGCRVRRGVALGMPRKNPEYLCAYPFYRSLTRCSHAPGTLFRQEPDEEEDDEEDDDDENEGDGDEGYSE